jgi:hypothetical protein
MISDDHKVYAITFIIVFIVTVVHRDEIDPSDAGEPVQAAGG